MVMLSRARGLISPPSHEFKSSETIFTVGHIAGLVTMTM